MTDMERFISLYDPALSVNFSPLPSAVNADMFGRIDTGEFAVPCNSLSPCSPVRAYRAIGTDSAGSAYALFPSGGWRTDVAPHFRPGPLAASVHQWKSARESATLIAEINTIVCLDGGICDRFLWFSGRGPIFDPVQGTMQFFARGQECLCIPDINWPCTTVSCTAEQHFTATVDGFPRLFDTLLTFIPGQQAMSIVTPAHPDGFRSADSLQVCTGDVRTMPDWSQAQPLACTAAVNPTPGQVVSVADPLPNPAVGEGRYYLVASQSGPDRRLGGQYVNAAFLAREPAGLPVCQ
jgi:hypothetical protein